MLISSKMEISLFSTAVLTKNMKCMQPLFKLKYWKLRILESSALLKMTKCVKRLNIWHCKIGYWILLDQPTHPYPIMSDFHKPTYPNIGYPLWTAPIHKSSLYKEGVRYKLWWFGLVFKAKIGEQVKWSRKTGLTSLIGGP